MSTSTTNRPSLHLSALPRDYPSVWRLVDQFRAGHGKSLPGSADWCFVPLDAAYAIVSGGRNNRVPFELVRDIARIGTLAAWRVSQGGYWFDPSIMDALWDALAAGELPVELFFRLPDGVSMRRLRDVSFSDLHCTDSFVTSRMIPTMRGTMNSDCS